MHVVISYYLSDCTLTVFKNRLLMLPFVYSFIYSFLEFWQFIPREIQMFSRTRGWRNWWSSQRNSTIPHTVLQIHEYLHFLHVFFNWILSYLVLIGVQVSLDVCGSYGPQIMVRVTYNKFLCNETNNFNNFEDTILYCMLQYA